MFNYFFGSDNRSVIYLEFIYKQNNDISVVTTAPLKRGRGNKLKHNPVESFCIKKNINYKYFNQKDTYDDMNNGLCVSFKNIFSDKFLKNNNDIYNVHLSLLPKFKGPSPVETQILSGESEFGYTIFKINKFIDGGPVLFNNKINFNDDPYASNIYELMFIDFSNSYNKIINDTLKLQKQEKSNTTYTNKFSKNDFCINDNSVEMALKKIRAFDVIGPAYIVHDNKVIKIHNYVNESRESGFKVEDGYIFPLEITPEGKNRMLMEDYVRGLK